MYFLKQSCLFHNKISQRVCFFVTVPEGEGETIDLEVYKFTGAGGVALSMYNTDEVCLSSHFHIGIFQY